MGVLGQAIDLLVTLNREVWQVIGLSLRISGVATAIAMMLGIPLGYLIGRTRHAWQAFVLIMVNTGMSFPPVVVGLAVYMLLSRTGPLGMLGLLFTPTAMVVAQVVIALPIVTGVTTAAVASIPLELRLQARSLGASWWQEAWLTLKEARSGVMAAVVAGFGGVISEVGAVMLVGGNIQGQTRVMTTAIVLETRKGEFGLALSLGLILIGLALVINVTLTYLQRSGARYER